MICDLMKILCIRWYIWVIIFTKHGTNNNKFMIPTLNF